MAIFECTHCGQVFEKDGLRVVVHEKAIGHVCPECLSGSVRVTMTLIRPCPGKDYAIEYISIDDDSIHNDNAH